MKSKTNKLTYPALVVMILALVLFSSCGKNRLKTDEKSLTKQILTEEEQLAHEAKLRAEREKQLADSLAKLPKGFRFPEERGVDPDLPPMIIDIANSLDNIADLSLSDVASSIEYIRMEPVPDSTLPTNMKYKYYLMDGYIVALNLYGIQLFNKEGQYIQTIVKNEFGGTTYDEENDRVSIIWGDYMKVGGGTSVWARGNDLFYHYNNSITGQSYIMECDCAESGAQLTATLAPEKQERITGAGKISVDLNYGNTPQQSKRWNSGSSSMTSNTFLANSGVFAPDRNVSLHTVGGKFMMHVVNNNGELLTSFTKHERVENYTKSVGRGTDGGNRYEKNGNLFYRTNFNDTIFQFIPPNRLLPVYVYNLGVHKLSMLQGMDPGFDLTGKIIPMDFADTKNFLFLTFTKDSYDCPNTRRDKSLKLYRALFNKKTRHLSILTADPSDYYAPILKNDIDGGVPVWPDEIMIGKNGEIMVSLRGKELKNHVASDSYKNSTAPITNKDKLKQVALKATDNDQILMIVK